jgi:hypothetical protein
MRSYHFIRLKVQTSAPRLDEPKGSVLKVAAVRMVLPVRWDRMDPGGVRIEIKIRTGLETSSVRQSGGLDGVGSECGRELGMKNEVLRRGVSGGRSKAIVQSK